MRLATALSIVAHSLPVASKNEEENNVNPILPIDNIENHNDVRQRFLLNRNEKTSSVRRSFAKNLFRERRQARIKNNIANSRGTLRNLVVTTKQDECDPSIYEPDVGLLWCDFGKYCKPSEAAGLGGFCVDAPKLDLWFEDSKSHNVIAHDYVVLGPGYVDGSKFITDCFNSTLYNKSLCFRALWEPNAYIGENCTIAIDGVQCNSCQKVTNFREDPNTKVCSGPLGELLFFYDRFAFDCENAGSGTADYSCLDDIVTETLFGDSKSHLTYVGSVWHSPGCDVFLPVDPNEAVNNKICFNATLYNKSLCLSYLPVNKNTIGTTCIIEIDGFQCNSCYYISDLDWVPKACSGPLSSGSASYNHFIFDCENAGSGTGNYSCLEDIQGSDSIVMGCNETLAYFILRK